MKLPFLKTERWRWRWMHQPKGEDILHRIKSYEKESEEYPAALENVTTVCNEKFNRLHMPGVFSRLGSPRCEECCRILKILPGYGAPANSDIEEPEEIGNDGS